MLIYADYATLPCRRYMPCRCHIVSLITLIRHDATPCRCRHNIATLPLLILYDAVDADKIALSMPPFRYYCCCCCRYDTLLLPRRLRCRCYVSARYAFICRRRAADIRCLFRLRYFSLLCAMLPARTRFDAAITYHHGIVHGLINSSRIHR